MALSNILGQYADIKPVLDAALSSNGGRYELPSRQQAIRWRQRAYHYRSLLRKRKAAEQLIPGIEPSTPYDSMKITIDDTTCVIDFYRPMGNWTPNEGDDTQPFARAEAEAEDDLDRAAQALARTLTGEG